MPNPPPPIDVTLTVSMDAAHDITITGGDNGGEDITVPGVSGNVITFQRAGGQTWTFDEFTMRFVADQAQNFSMKPTFLASVGDDQIVLNDDDQNDTLSTLVYKYSLVLKSGTETFTKDPKVFNKSGRTP